MTSIQPYVVTTSRTITSFTVTCDSLTLFETATFRVDSFDSEGNIVIRQYVPITNEQYLAWQNNDNYIINLMASILDYTIN
jgi:hypothetical protein